MEKVINKKILVITERYFPERFLINDLTAYWSTEGYDVKVLTQVPSYPGDRLFEGYPNVLSVKNENGIHVMRFKTVLGYHRNILRKIWNYICFMIRACVHVFHECRTADIVFVFHTGPLTQAMPLYFAKKVFNKRTVIWTQDVWPDTVFAYGFPEKGSFAVILKQFVRFIYRVTDRVIVSSPGFVDRLAPYLGNDRRASFIPQWAPEAFIRGVPSGLSFQCSGTSFVFTGNIGTMQNLPNLIRAFGQIGEEQATLFIIGDGSMRRELDYIVETEKIFNVVFIGSIEQSKVKSCIEACDFSVISLVNDRLISLTIPAKFQAYLAAGRPVIAIAKGEVSKIVEDDQLGLVGDPANVVDIVKTIRRAIASDKNERARWANNVTRLNRERYNREKTMVEITSIVAADERIVIKSS